MPENCLFNKGAVGCGGTTVAIEGEGMWIIAVPTVNLVKNKEHKYNVEEPHRGYEILGVYSGNCTDEQIAEFARGYNEKKTILCTYDSLERVFKLIVPNKFRLMIDEYHTLLTQYSFRSRAVNKVLSLYDKFQSYIFMSATPINEEFILKELGNIDVVNAVWAEQVPSQVNCIQCKNVQTSVIRMIEKFLNGTEAGNAFFYINDIDFIGQVIRKFNKLYSKKGLEMTLDNTRAIYSQSNPKEIKIGKWVLPNSLTTTESKKINFITSTAFEGCDLMDEDGKTIIVSAGHAANTMLDIATQCVQIIGRIRNSKYNESVTHIFTKSRYYGQTKDQFELFVKDNIRLAEAGIEMYKKAENDDQREFIVKGIDKAYLMHDNKDQMMFNEDGVMIFDYNRVIADRFAFNHTSTIYLNLLNISTAYSSVGKIVVQDTFSEGKINVRYDREFSDIKSLVDTCNEIYAHNKYYTELKESGEINLIPQHPDIDAMYEKYPYLEQYIHYFGTMGFDSDSIRKDYLLARIESVKASKQEAYTKANVDESRVALARVMDTLIRPMVGGFYDLKTIKAKLQEAYGILGVDATARASDIEALYNVRAGKVRRGDKRVNGFYITGIKYKIQK